MIKMAIPLGRKTVKTNKTAKLLCEKNDMRIRFFSESTIR